MVWQRSLFSTWPTSCWDGIILRFSCKMKIMAKDMQPIVSVVVINYNNERYLATSLGASAHLQEVLEVIVVDDASTDGSMGILKNLGVTVIQNEKNFGPVRSRNIGARMARGKYILFLDSDAAIAPNYVAGIVDFLENHQKVGVVSGKVLGDDGKRMWFNFGN